MNKHTPGPWKAEIHCVWGGPNLDRYVAATGTGIGEQEQQANARLIAAAPDLLAALEAIEARISGTYDNPALMDFGPLSIDAEADCSAIARAAIAKARGQE